MVDPVNSARSPELQAAIDAERLLITRRVKEQLRRQYNEAVKDMGSWDDLKEQILNVSPLADCEVMPVAHFKRQPRRFRRFFWEFWLPRQKFTPLVPANGKVRNVKLIYHQRYVDLPATERGTQQELPPYQCTTP